MNEAKQREIASKGGKAAYEKGTAREFDPSDAGKKGGASREGSGLSSPSPSSSSSGSSARHAKAGSQGHKHA